MELSGLLRLPCREQHRRRRLRVGHARSPWERHPPDQLRGGLSDPERVRVRFQHRGAVFIPPRLRPPGQNRRGGAERRHLQPRVWRPRRNAVGLGMLDVCPRVEQHWNRGRIYHSSGSRQGVRAVRRGRAALPLLVVPRVRSGGRRGVPRVRGVRRRREGQALRLRRRAAQGEAPPRHLRPRARQRGVGLSDIGRPRHQRQQQRQLRRQCYGRQYRRGVRRGQRHDHQCCRGVRGGQ
mmetsp:Transcript_21172/g.59559  ORF Transcript_21172/g.59559 Transcript_21172/m.59559 type:complete len:237 (+) Transcript_21172:519-1229(+)